MVLIGLGDYSKKKESEPMTTYALGKDGIAAEALDLQQRIVGQDSLNFVMQAGLKTGDQVWEFGSGPGSMTFDLAAQVGPTGHVTAIDQSAEHLQRLEEQMHEKRFENISTQVMDIEKEVLPAHEANFVFGRYILMHLNNPEGVLKKCQSILLKPGGRACFIEGCWDESTIQGPYADELTLFVKSVVALGKHCGVDYTLGRNLKKMLEKTGFSEIGSKKKMLTFTGSTLSVLWQRRLHEMGEKFIEAGIASRSQVENWQGIAEKLPQQSGTSTMHSPVYAGWGRVSSPE